MTASFTLAPRHDGDPSGPLLFFIQGWPDEAAIWDGQVAHFGDRYHCVRVTMPNFGDTTESRWGYNHQAIVAALTEAIRSCDSPVTLLTHDWGAWWGYMVHHKHPELVRRMIALDVSPVVSVGPKEAVGILAYQSWLMAACVIGGGLGDRMTQGIAARMRVPRANDQLRAAMNYPYLYLWRDLLTGRVRKDLGGYRPEIPLLYVYGERKPFHFHNQRWLDRLNKRPPSKAIGLNWSHWVMHDPQFNGLVDEWLEASA